MPETPPNIVHVLRRLGTATPEQILDEMEDETLASISTSLQVLAKAGLVEDHGTFYRHKVPPVALSRWRGGSVFSHNDPQDIFHDVERACASHKGSSRCSLEGGFRSLIGGAKHELHIVSPFLDQQAVNRFLPEFRRAFEAGASIHIVTRGVAKREDYTRKNQYAARIRGLDVLWRLFDRHKARKDQVFRLSDYTNYHYEPEDEEAAVELDPPTEPRRKRYILATIHQKAIVQDRTWAYVGSGEFRATSFGASGEAGLLVRGDHARAMATIADCYARRGAVLDPARLLVLLGPVPVAND
jgi:phosphatidylserine/phosphatidylglycerophosphate/cardiolipin synthase-like enzyme